MSGYGLKVVERGGVKLEDILHKSNPTEGKNCDRENCILCETKLRTGKSVRQSCEKRSAVYETWCEICETRDRMMGMGNNENLTLHKYIGESAHSVYERGTEHQMDAVVLKSGSHILKHCLESPDFGGISKGGSYKWTLPH